jgi:hypothetical protein
VDWIGVGWIPRNDPSPDRRVRTEADGTVVITMQEGHQGWRDYGFALLRDLPEDTKSIADRLADAVAPAAANAIMGQWFWVVPDNTVLRACVEISASSGLHSHPVSWPGLARPPTTWPSVPLQAVDGAPSRPMTQRGQCPAPIGSFIPARALKRRLRIDLVRDDGAVIASTPCGTTCYPLMTDNPVREYRSKTDGRTITVCGPRAGCPQFLVRPDFPEVH